MSTASPNENENSLPRREGATDPVDAEHDVKFVNMNDGMYLFTEVDGESIRSDTVVNLGDHA